MILPLSAIWGGSANFLDGNAQLFDGVFDYDIISSMEAIQIPYSILINAEILGGLTYVFFDNRDGGLVSSNGLAVAVFPDRTIFLNNQLDGGQRVSTSSALPLGNNNIIITASSGSISIYINGVDSTVSVNAPIISNPSPVRDAKIGVLQDASSFKYKGKFKTLEILNREATAQEVADASATKSFRGAGIAFDSGDYYLAVDFDKQNGENPTTFAGTPSYTITGVGGTTYTPYL